MAQLFRNVMMDLYLYMVNGDEHDIEGMFEDMEIYDNIYEEILGTMLIINSRWYDISVAIQETLFLVNEHEVV